MTDWPGLYIADWPHLYIADWPGPNTGDCGPVYIHIWLTALCPAAQSHSTQRAGNEGQGHHEV